MGYILLEVKANQLSDPGLILWNFLPKHPKCWKQRDD